LLCTFFVFAAMARRTSLLAVVIAATVGLAAVRLATFAFVPAPQPRVHAATIAAMVGAMAPLPALAEEAAKAAAEAAPAAAEAAKAAAEAAPAAAEEGGFLNFGRIPLGGGFAINLDIPESGIVNLVVIIAGLFYLLGPVLSESMATREKEIQQDIDDAISKYDESVARLAEAEKNKAQADQVVAEIEGSIEKDKAEFLDSITKSTDATLARQEEMAAAALKGMGASADIQVESFIKEQAVNRGIQELKFGLKEDQKSKYMDKMIEDIPTSLVRERID
jgi:F0F1-type ATP synthase membrane subunit b/b'